MDREVVLVVLVLLLVSPRVAVSGIGHEAWRTALLVPSCAETALWRRVVFALMLTTLALAKLAGWVVVEPEHAEAAPERDHHGTYCLALAAGCVRAVRAPRSFAVAAPARPSGCFGRRCDCLARSWPPLTGPLWMRRVPLDHRSLPTIYLMETS